MSRLTKQQQQQQQQQQQRKASEFSLSRGKRIYFLIYRVSLRASLDGPTNQDPQSPATPAPRPISFTPSPFYPRFYLSWSEEKYTKYTEVYDRSLLL